MNSSPIRPRGRPRTLSAAESLLWSHLRDGRLEGWRFYLRRPASDGTGASFLCPDAAISIHVDARSEADPDPLTFTSFEVLATTESVLQAILLALRTALFRRRMN